LPESSAHRSTRANFAAVSPALLRLLGGDFDDGAGDRGAQPARGQPRRPVQHLRLGGAGFVLIQQAGGSGDDLAPYPRIVPSRQRRVGAGQVRVQAPGRAVRLVRPGPGLAQRVRDLVAVNSASSGLELRRSSSAIAASLRAAA
jgi:hypothetical protein